MFVNSFDILFSLSSIFYFIQSNDVVGEYFGFLGKYIITANKEREDIIIESPSKYGIL